jgi:hypothetical protein
MNAEIHAAVNVMVMDIVGAIKYVSLVIKKKRGWSEFDIKIF